MDPAEERHRPSAGTKLYCLVSAKTGVFAVSFITQIHTNYPNVLY